VTSVADHDQTDTSCFFEQHFGRPPLNRRALALDRGPQLFRHRNESLDDCLGALATGVRLV
jgi:hypothetical protein